MKLRCLDLSERMCSKLFEIIFEASKVVCSSNWVEKTKRVYLFRSVLNPLLRENRDSTICPVHIRIHKLSKVRLYLFLFTRRFQRIGQITYLCEECASECGVFKMNLSPGHRKEPALNPPPLPLPLPSYFLKWFWISFLFHKCPTPPTPSSPSHSYNSLKIMFRYKTRWKDLTDLVNTTEFDVWVYFVINQSTLSLLRSHL